MEIVLPEGTQQKPFIPLVDLKAQKQQLGNEINEAIEGVLERCDFILGRDVGDFEDEFAAFCGARHAIGCGNGTDALHLSLRALGVGPGDEVIMPAMTFVATALGISLTGAKPVLVDVEAETGLIDPAEIDKAVTPKTKAILPVHLFGQCADMDAIAEIASGHGLLVIEDAAQAHGASYKERRAGALGRAGCFSFYPAKNLGAYGDGGMVTTDDADLGERLHLLGNWGSRRKYHHEEAGLNSRLDTVQAAVLRVKLKHLETWNEARRRHAARYDEALSDMGGVTLTRYAEGAVYHLYVIRVDDRDGLVKALNEAGIGAGIHYPFCVHELDAYKNLGYRPGDFPHSEGWARNCLSLPIYAELPGDAVDRAAAVIGKAVG